MKHKLFFRTLATMLMAFCCVVNVWGTDVTLTENFNSTDATSNNYNCTSGLTTAANLEGFDYTWTATGGTTWQNGIKLGTKSSTSSISSSNFISSIPAGTSFTIKVYAAQWGSDGGSVTVTYNSSEQTIAPTNDAITTTTSEYDESAFSASTNFEFTKVEGVDELTIASSSKRILIDKVEVVYSSGGGGGGTTYTDYITECKEETCENKYTFAYWTGSEEATKLCFEQVGETSEYQITGFTIPATTTYKYWVGYNTYFYESNLGTGDASGNKAKSANNDIKYMPVANLQGSNCSGTGDSYKHAATGAYGLLRIYSNSSADNLYVGFSPAGYQLRVGSGDSWSNIQLTNTAGSTWESEVLELTSDLQAKNYYVNVWTGATYSSSDAGAAINNWTDGDNTIGSGKKKTGAGNEDWANLSASDNGAHGKFRTWTDNCAANGYLHFVPYYQASFDANGGDCSTSVLPASRVSVEAETAARTITLPEATKTGYTLKWSDGVNQYEAGASVVLTSDKAFTAVWTAKTTTITLDINGGNDGEGSVTATYGQALPGFTVATRNPDTNKWKLAGYYTAKTDGFGTMVINANGTLVANISGYTDVDGKWIKEDASVTLYAHWTPIYTITWQTATSSTTTEVEKGNNLVLPAEDPTSCDEDTYTTFIGWYDVQHGTAENPSGSLSGNKATAEVSPTKNMTYYAVWADGAAEGGYEVVTDAGTLAAGDKLLFEGTAGSADGSTYNYVSSTLAANTQSYLQAVKYTDWNNLPATVAPLTLGGSAGNWTFTYTQDGSQVTIATTSAKKMCISTTTGAVSTWSISIDAENKATISSTTSDYGRILLNYNSGSAERFLNYATTTSTSVSMALPKIYRHVAGATGYISTCCASEAAATINPESSSLVLSIDGKASTTVTHSVTGTTSYRLYGPVITPDEGATATLSSANYKTTDGSYTFNATKAGTYTLKHQVYDAKEEVKCSKYTSIQIEVEANPILNVSTPTITSLCGSEGDGAVVNIASRYMAGTLTASVSTTAKANGGHFEICATESGTYATTDISSIAAGNEDSKAETSIYVRYVAAEDETTAASGTLTISDGVTSKEIELSTTPTCGPNIKIAGNTYITTVSGSETYTNAPITITGKRMPTGVNKLRISYIDPSSNVYSAKTGDKAVTGSKFRMRDYNPSASPAAQGSAVDAQYINITPTDGEFSVSYYLTYTPSGDNVRDNWTLKIEALQDQTPKAESTIDVHGRSVPTQFVLAVNTGSEWVAVPADMVPPYGGSENQCGTGVGTHAPYPIEVNGDVTEASNVPARAIYKGAARSSTYTQAWTMRFESVSQTGYYLWGSGTAQAEGEEAGVITTIANQKYNDSERTKWTLETTDGVNYQIHLNSSINSNKLGYYSGRIGQYKASGAKHTFRILPVVNSCTYHIKPVMTLTNYTAENATVTIPYDGTTAYEISTNGTSGWTSITGSWDKNNDCKKLNFSISNATYKGQNLWFRPAGDLCEDATSEESIHILNPVITDPGTQNFTGVVNVAFNGSFDISGTELWRNNTDITIKSNSNSSVIGATINNGTVTITKAATATAGTYSTVLTFASVGAADVAVTVNVTIQALASVTMTMDDVSNGVLCGDETKYCRFNKAFYESSSSASYITDKSGLENSIFLVDLTDDKEEAVTNTSAHTYSLTNGVPTLSYIASLLKNGHTYKFVYRNNAANDGAGYYAKEGDVNIAFADAETAPFLFVASCNKPNVLTPCVTATTATLNWLDPGCTGSTSSTVNVYTKSETEKYKQDFTSNTKTGIVIRSKKDAAKWVSAYKSGVNTCTENGFPLNFTSNNYTGALYSPTFTNMCGTTYVEGKTVTLEVTAYNNYTTDLILIVGITKEYGTSNQNPTTFVSVKYDGTSKTYVSLSIPSKTTKTFTIALSDITSSEMIFIRPDGTAAKSSQFLQKVRVLSVGSSPITNSPFTVENCGDELNLEGLIADKTYYYTITRGENTTDEASFTTWKSGKTASIDFGGAATHIYATGSTPATAEINVSGKNLTQEPVVQPMTNPFEIVSKDLKYDCYTGELTGTITVQFTPGTSTSQTLTLGSAGKDYTTQVISHVCPDYQGDITQTVNEGEVTINLGHSFSGTVSLADNGNPSNNLLSNPGFESDATDWGASAYSAYATCEVSSSVQHSGSKSMLVKEYSAAGKLDRNGKKYYALYHAAQQLDKGHYSLTAWVRGVGQYTDADVYIGASQGSGSINLGQSNVTTIKGTGWVQLQCQFSLDKSTQVQVFIARNNATGTNAQHRVYVDDFVLNGSTSGDPMDHAFVNTNTVVIDGLYPSHNYSYTVRNMDGCEWGPYSFQTESFATTGLISATPNPVDLSTTLNTPVSGLMTISTEFMSSSLTIAKGGTNPDKFTISPTTVTSTGGTVRVTFNGQGVAGQTFTAIANISGTDINGTNVSQDITLKGTIAAGTSWSGPTVEVVDVDATHLTIEHNIADATGANIYLSRELQGDEIVKNVGCELFFSKYFEAYQNVKLWAIYNPTAEAIDLTDMYVLDAHAGKDDKGVINWSSTSYCALAGLGKGADANKIEPNEEILVYCPGNTGADNQMIACAATQADMSNWNMKETGSTSATAFNGNDALCLVRGSGNTDYGKTNLARYKVWNNTLNEGEGDYEAVELDWRYIDWNEKEYEMIDLIGARTNSNLADNSKCVIPSFYTYDGDVATFVGNGDDKGWTAKGHDMSNGAATLSTNRCLLVREKSVKSGSPAVLTNVGDFATLANEWQGAYVPVKSTSQEMIETTCANFAFVGDFNYSEYYNKYTELDEEVYDFGTQNADGSYTGEFTTLEDYTCQNILIEVTKTSTVGGVEVKETKASLEYKVPIIVDDNMATNGEKFTQFDDCSTCNVVVLNGQKLQTHVDGKNTVNDVKVYPGGNILVNTGHTLTVNNMEIQSQNDNVAYAKVDGTLTIGNDLVHLKRIDAYAWYPFALPYDCDMASIRQLNGKVLGTYGTDWFIKEYDGAARAKTGTKTNPNAEYWKLVESGTLNAYQGYIIGIGGINEKDADEARRLKTVYFAPKDQGASYTETGEETKSYTINGYTGAATAAGQLYDKGWNFVANPYVSIYQQNNTGLDNHTELVMGHVTAGGDYVETSNVYVYIPNDETKNTYYCYLATDNKAKMLPFRPYFVQALAETGSTNTLTYNKAGRRLNVAAPARTASAQPGMVKIVATGENGQYDHLGVWVGDEFTNGYDELYDCMKMYAENYTQPQMYTYSKDGENLAMAYNAVPDNYASDLKMFIFMPLKGQYTLHIDSVNSQLQTIDHVLLKKNNVVVADLTQGDYKINNTSMYSRDKSYSLTIQRIARITTSIEDSWVGAKPVAYYDGSGLNISNVPVDAKIFVYDMVGRCITTCAPDGAGVARVNIPISGVYNVTISANNGVVDIKTIVK